MEDQKFNDWLNDELKERGWSQADLVRKTGISSAQLSRISTGLRSPGVDTCRAIARALGYSAPHVLRIAGLIDDEKDRTDNLDTAEHLFLELSPADQLEAIEYMRMKIRLSEKKPKK